MEQYYLEIPDEIDQEFFVEVSKALVNLVNGLKAKFIDGQPKEFPECDLIQFRGELGKKIFDGINKSIFDGFNFTIDYIDDKEISGVSIIKRYNAIYIEELLNLNKKFGDGEMSNMKIEKTGQSTHVIQIEFKEKEQN